MSPEIDTNKMNMAKENIWRPVAAAVIAVGTIFVAGKDSEVRANKTHLLDESAYTQDIEFDKEVELVGSLNEEMKNIFNQQYPHKNDSPADPVEVSSIDSSDVLFDQLREVFKEAINEGSVQAASAGEGITSLFIDTQTPNKDDGEFSSNSGKELLEGEDVWIVLADCESGDGKIGPPYYAEWDYDGSSGFDGGLQFHPDTWERIGTEYDYAWQAPAEVQITAAQEWLDRTNWNQWLACRDKMIAGGYAEEMLAEGPLE